MRPSLLATLVAALAACGPSSPSGEVREWRASDHAVPAELDPARNPDAVDPGAEGQGEQTSLEAERNAARILYAQLCAGCHGESGRGDGAARPNGAQLPDLTDPAWQASRTDVELAQTLVQGRGLMPGLGDRLAPEGVAALVRHVRQLSRDAAPATP